jgi:hypothetical protein
LLPLPPRLGEAHFLLDSSHVKLSVVIELKTHSIVYFVILKSYVILVYGVPLLYSDVRAEILTIRK